MNKTEIIKTLGEAGKKGFDAFEKALRSLELDRRRRETRFTVDSKGKVRKNFKNGGLVNFKGTF